MANLILFNKPHGVMCQFRESNSKSTLAEFINMPGFYPAGRLDQDSEGLVLLTNDGQLQARITEPRHKLPKSYWVQVEGEITPAAIASLKQGVDLKDGRTRPATVKFLRQAPLEPRIPAIRYRANITTSWITITLSEGRNRQVRRMTAHVGFPTLRLFRYQIGYWNIQDVEVGAHRMEQVNLPERSF